MRNLEEIHREIDELSEHRTDLYHELSQGHNAELRDEVKALDVRLDALWDDVLHQRRRFKLYRQMKMYNDPELNPAIYKHSSSA